MPLMKSWVTSANDPDHPFPLNNLPYGVFAANGAGPHCGVAIGDMILDLTAAEADGPITLADAPLFDVPFWNEFMAEGPAVWAALRERLTALLSEGSDAQGDLEPFLVAQSDAEMHLPIAVSEYTDFYAGRNHAFNVGSMFRGPENALPPNWLHIPIGYNGRASSVVVSGTEIRRPWGQLKSPDRDRPAFLPSRRFDIELEMGAIVGIASDGPITVQEADDNIFGYVLLNDWSARDIQAWEYQPLGPFQAKATATSIGPWIVAKAALEPFRTNTPEREFELLDHLKDCGPMLYDIDLVIVMAPEGQPATTLSRTNYKEMYYSAAQQLAHHTTSGCPMTPGDLLGSGTISGPTIPERGSLLELSWGGKEPITLDTGETRSFIEDGDTLTLIGNAKGDGYTIGFGDCTGKVLPALDDPYMR
ncbi:MAG: fumarylacetoacetase [Rhodobacteraceae bacterium]|nr:fumarylacetoacetase [Paracoccaceae bacterium]